MIDMKSFNRTLVSTVTLVFILATISCKKPSSTDDNIGSADITLTYGSQTLKITGDCGWASAGGVKYIGANHNTNSLRAFEASFNISAPPTITTTYTLVADQLDETPSNVWVSFVDMTNGSSYVSWVSSDNSGQFTLHVDGKKITANLDGIILEPGSNNTTSPSSNVQGILSGSLIFYRE